MADTVTDYYSGSRVFVGFSDYLGISVDKVSTVCLFCLCQFDMCFSQYNSWVDLSIFGAYVPNFKLNGKVICLSILQQVSDIIVISHRTMFTKYLFTI